MKSVENLEGEINYRKLKAKVSQQILRRLDDNFISYFRAIEDWKANRDKYSGQPKPPNYIKADFYTLIYNYQAFQIVNSRAVLDIKNDLSIKIPKQLLNRNIKQIIINRKHYHFEAVFIYEDEKELVQIENSNRVVGIDLGVNNLATVASNIDLKPFIINGKPIKSINQFYNKNYAKYSSRLHKEGKSMWSKRLEKLTTNRNNKVKDYLHKSTNIVLKSYIENSISTVVIGNISHLSSNNINLGKRNNQNITSFPFGQFVELLKYKLEAHNIKLKIVDESYTSKASFLDGDFLPKKYDKEKSYTFSGKRVKRGLYKTKDGILINADLNGALNIIRKFDSSFSKSDISTILKYSS